MTTIKVVTPTANRKELAEAFGQNQSAVRRLEAMTQDITVTLPDAIGQGADVSTVVAFALMAMDTFVIPPAPAGRMLQSAQTRGTSLASDAAVSVATLLLAPGIWDVSGVVVFNPDPTTVIEQATAGVSQVSSTLGTPDTYQSFPMALSTDTPINVSAPVMRITLVAAATLFLIAKATFVISTMTADGYISARPAQ